jgi:hypothetical protein
MDTSRTMSHDGPQQLLKCDCAKCGAPLAFPAHAVGLEVTCPHCDGPTVLTTKTLAPDSVKTLGLAPPSLRSDNRNKYSARKSAKPVNFYCQAPNARYVAVIGEFNRWDPKVNPMKRQLDGSWFAQVDLHHGHHHYLFWVDGEKRLDPRAQGVSRNERNERVSMIAVS